MRQLGPFLLGLAFSSVVLAADQAAGMEQVQELVVATILVHQVEDREVHEVNSQEIIVDTPDGQENTTAGGLEGPTTKLVT